jgi:hypothetical protein
LTDQLHASKHLPTQDAGRFLQEIGQVECLLNALVAVAAPEMFTLGSRAIEAVKKMKLHQNSSYWNTVFLGMAVIVNRETPRHRDSGGGLSHPDLLLSAGEHTGAVLQLPDISTVLEYDPGTAVLVSGLALSHSVPMTWTGHRICLAHFMKDKVHDRLGVPRPPLISLKDYDILKAPGYLSRVESVKKRRCEF